MINLGDKVKDKVSGFEGVAIARTEWLNGCARIIVQPSIDKEGKLPTTEQFDEPQMEVTAAKHIELGPKDTGGPAIMPTRQKA